MPDAVRVSGMCLLFLHCCEQSAIQGEQCVVLLYSVANFLLSSGGPQPCLDISQQFRSGLVFPRVEVSRLLQRYGPSKKRQQEAERSKGF